MTPEERIDAALDSVLRASGSALSHYTIPQTLQGMREAMRKFVIGYERYEKLRKLNPRQFSELYDRNIRDEGRFDDLVDQLPNN